MVSAQWTLVGSMVLVDAGMSLAAPVAGVAIGLVTKFKNNDTKHLQDNCILTNILSI